MMEKDLAPQVLEGIGGWDGEVAFLVTRLVAQVRFLVGGPSSYAPSSPCPLIVVGTPPGIEISPFTAQHFENWNRSRKLN